jgi:hypothetical protein
MVVRDIAKQLARALVRRATPVAAGELTRTTPVSKRFGLDRGTPIDRYFIERFLADHSAAIRGDVMEIGDATYTRRFGRAVRASHVLHATRDNPAATIVGDLARPETLTAASIDCFICTQTLNFIYPVEQAIAGLHHVLRPGGTVLATVAGISQISRYDMERWGDYWRFTDASARRLFAGAFAEHDVDVVSFGNVAVATAFLQGLAVEDLPDRRVLDVHDADYQLVLGIVARKRR